MGSHPELLRNSRIVPTVPAGGRRVAIAPARRAGGARAARTIPGAVPHGERRGAGFIFEADPHGARGVDAAEENGQRYAGHHREGAADDVYVLPPRRPTGVGGLLRGGFGRDGHRLRGEDRVQHGPAVHVEFDRGPRIRDRGKE